MSSLYVRTTFRNWVTDPVGFTVPYYDTINRSVSPIDAIWLTLDFEPEFSEEINFCRDAIEEGVVDFVFSGRAGVGDTALLTAAEADMAWLKTQTDPTGRLVIRSIQAPEEFTAGDAEVNYRIVFGVEYVFHN